MFHEEGKLTVSWLQWKCEKSGWFGEFKRHDGQDLWWVVLVGRVMSGVPGYLGFRKGDTVIHSSFVYWTEHLPGARSCSRCWGYSSKQNRLKFLPMWSLQLQGGGGIIPPDRWREMACWGCRRPSCGILGTRRGDMPFSGKMHGFPGEVTSPERGFVLGAETPRPKEVKPESFPKAREFF